MAISPTSGKTPGPINEIGKLVRNNTEEARQGRLAGEKNEAKVEQQRVRRAEPSRRAQNKEAAERARERRAERKRGGNVDVRA